MKNLFIIMVVIFGGLYYFFKDKGINDVHKAIGTAGSKKLRTKSDLKKEAEKINKYDVGNCIRLAKSNNWEVYKITKVDLERKDYHYIFCVRFKGCQEKVYKEIITNFEYDYPMSAKVACP